MPRHRLKPSLPVDFSPLSPIATDFAADGHVRVTFDGLSGRSDLPRPHLHNVFEVGLIHEGRATIQIGDKWLDFVAGDVSIITPSEPHRAFYPVKCVCSWMFFDIPRLLAHSAAESSLMGVESLAGPGFVNVFRGREYPGISGIAQEMAREFEHRAAYHKDSLRSLLVSLLARLHRLALDGDSHFPNSGVSSVPAYGAIERISPAIAYMHQHYAEQIDMNDLAARVCMSASNFRRVFNRCLGCSPHDYLTDYRVSAATALLIAGTKTVEQVAEESGIVDPSSFRRAFKKRTGKSPISVRVGNRRGKRRRESSDSSHA